MDDKRTGDMGLTLATLCVQYGYKMMKLIRRIN